MLGHGLGLTYGLRRSPAAYLAAKGLTGFTAGFDATDNRWWLPDGRGGARWASKAEFAAQYSCSSTPTYVDRAGVLRTAAANELRLDYSRGIARVLPEGSATNLNTYSQDLSNAAYVVTNINKVSGEILGPDATSSAYRIVRSSTSNAFVTKPNASTSGTYTVSAFVKLAYVGDAIGLRIQGTYPNRGDAVFNIAAGTIVGVANSGTAAGATASISALGSGWFRVALTVTLSDSLTSVIMSPCASSASVSGFEAGSATFRDIFVWGLQLETGYVATSYIPTTAAAVTRAAGSFRLPAAVETILQTGMLTSLVKCAGGNQRNPSVLLGVAQLTSSLIRLGGVAGDIGVGLIDDTISPNTYGALPSGNTSSPFTVVSARSAAGRSLVVNNGTVGTQTTSVTPTGAIYLGAINAGVYVYNDGITRFAINPARLSDTQIKALTA